MLGFGLFVFGVHQIEADDGGVQKGGEGNLVLQPAERTSEIKVNAI